MTSTNSKMIDLIDQVYNKCCPSSPHVNQYAYKYGFQPWNIFLQYPIIKAKHQVKHIVKRCWRQWIFLARKLCRLAYPFLFLHKEIHVSTIERKVAKFFATFSFAFLDSILNQIKSYWETKINFVQLECFVIWRFYRTLISCGTTALRGGPCPFFSHMSRNHIVKSSRISIINCNKMVHNPKQHIQCRMHA